MTKQLHTDLVERLRKVANTTTTVNGNTASQWLRPFTYEESLEAIRVCFDAIDALQSLEPAGQKEDGHVAVVKGHVDRGDTLEEPKAPPDGWPMVPHLRVWQRYAWELRSRLAAAVQDSRDKSDALTAAMNTLRSMKAEAALSAPLPEMRGEILEEAAKICDVRNEINESALKYENPTASERIERRRWQAYEARACAAAIRDVALRAPRSSSAIAASEDTRQTTDQVLEGTAPETVVTQVWNICREYANRIDQIVRQPYSVKDLELEIHHAIKEALASPTEERNTQRRGGTLVG